MTQASSPEETACWTDPQPEEADDLAYEVVDDVEQEDMSAHQASPCTPAEALALLERGNQAFVDGMHHHRPMTEEWRESLIHNGQHPYAVVVTCSDARVQPAIIFHMHLGDLFVIRTVGGYIDRVGEASVEYGVGHLAAPLVVALGHTHCGLVQAAIDGHGDGVVREVAAEVAEILNGETDPRVAERINVRHTIASLMKNPTIRELAESGQIEVVGATYDMASGRVEWMA